MASSNPAAHGSRVTAQKSNTCNGIWLPLKFFQESEPGHPMQLLLWFAIASGHIGIWCATFNRTHATAWPRGWRKLIERAIILVTGGPLLAIPFWFGWSRSWAVTYAAAHSTWLTGYFILCSFAFCFFLFTWLDRILRLRRPPEVELLSSERIDVEQVVGKKLTAGWAANLLRLVPGNQATSFSMDRYRIDLSGGASETETIRIAQLTDLHFTGDIAREFFEQVVRQANAFQPDLVFLTGDIVDDMKCLDWIDPVLGNVRSEYGKFYVLGNHDRLIRDEQLLRTTIEKTGFRKVEGQWHDLPIRRSNLKITGNSLPWYKAALELGKLSRDPHSKKIRILLAHSPDQIDWARQRAIDLMFAGHTHGGQIRLPVVGPIIAPSQYGVRYASGQFRVGKTLMHVSRGLSGDDPIRLLCPPELGLFEIIVPATTAGSED